MGLISGFIGMINYIILYTECSVIFLGHIKLLHILHNFFYIVA